MTWQPFTSAPKDRTICVWLVDPVGKGGRRVLGWWDKRSDRWRYFDHLSTNIIAEHLGYTPQLWAELPEWPEP